MKTTKFALIPLLFLTIYLFTQKTESEQYILLTGANIIDGKGNPVKKDLQVLIEGEIIKTIGKDIKAPKGTKVIDCTGKTILPGLIDMHAHMYGRFNYCQRKSGRKH